MRSLFTVFLVFGALALTTSAVADDTGDQYYNDLAAYHEMSRAQLDSVAEVGLSPEELPAVIAVAQAAKTHPTQVARERSEGNTWTSVMKAHGVTPDIFYFMLSGSFDSKTYAPIFAKFNDQAHGKIHEVILDDEEVIALANLRFIYRHHDFSVFKVMAFRDNGKGFLKINNTVRQLKKERLKKEKEEARKAKQEQKNKETGEG